MKKIKKIVSWMAIAIVLFSFTSVDSGIWKADPAHSNLSFTAVHFGITDIEGSFKKFDATFTSSKEDFTDAVFEFTTEVTSISTNDEQRDAHLKSPDFFDAATYSTITFKSTAVRKIADKKYKIIGNLTMHGITKPIELDASIVKGMNLRSKKEFIGVKITSSLTRSAFGIGTSTPAVFVSDEVTIRGSAEFGKQ